MPINGYLLPVISGNTKFLSFNRLLQEPIPECNVADKATSLSRLMKVPAVIVTGMVVVVISTTWSFLDPTLEPHLRQVSQFPASKTPSLVQFQIFSLI